MIPLFLKEAYENKDDKITTRMNENIESMKEYSQFIQSKNIPANKRLSINYCYKNDSIKFEDENFQSEPLPDFFSTDFSFEKKSDEKFSEDKFSDEKFSEEDFFTIPFTGNEQKLHAIMTANDPAWVVFSKSSQNKILYNFKIKLSTEFNSLYKRSIYKQYDDSQLYNSLMRDDVDISAAYLHLVSDYLNVNILQVYLHGYEWVSLFNPNRATLLLWTHEDRSGCVLHTDGKSHLQLFEVNKLLLKNLDDVQPDRIFKMNIELNPLKKKYLTELRKKSKAELCEIAELKNISTDKKKDDIIKELMEVF